MKEQFTVYTAKNGSKYIQTKNHRVANIVHDVTNVRYYKLLIREQLIFSFQYSDELMNAIEVMDSLKIH